ncbi:MAG: GNAT family N-acetyltransferase [Clostridia bacterium]|nr:GNAT family N-acetyltransferase [Clostridia bacterium]
MTEYKKYRRGETFGYSIIAEGKEVGVMEYKDFWDGMPYLSLVRLEENYRGKGIGSRAIKFLEEQLRAQGAKALLTSTQSNERGQHFYRKLGFAESGCLILENTPFKQPMEMFFIKVL